VPNGSADGASAPTDVVTMRDIEYDPAEESAYECFECGTIVWETDSPDSCPDCGGSMRSRLATFE
jgi:magnesium transporter